MRLGLGSTIAFITLTTCSLHAETLQLLAWNVQGGGSDADRIARELAELQGYHCYALTDVSEDDVARLRVPLGDNYASVLGMTGRLGRCLMFYQRSRLQLRGVTELAEYDGQPLTHPAGEYGPPLVVRLHDMIAKQDLEIVICHFSNSNPETRQSQAEGLRRWGEMQKLAVIGLGTFNFDYDAKTLRGNRAFDTFMLDYRWRFIRPDPLVDTQWSDLNRDGQDDHPHVLQDFGYLSGNAYNWEAKSKVIVRPNDFPDSPSTSDHRPVELRVVPRIAN